ncbi:Hypothetical protein PHPALM_3089 [Phytophthora palmivora]|uniref:Chromo domain-containing protein n=1 Tax=Phytophthora palmivora TaxID=4796 RepID=A0A2P4YNA9_9STRA|nr:Hypothetical protein PHPALM_3089 [Phytophthora palmivora]
MRARCRSTGEDYNLVTQNVKKSFDAELRETFCSLRLRKEVADVTEGQIIAEIKALLAKVKNDDMPDIKLLFKQELKIHMKETDIEARILSYFQRFKQVVKENGLDDVFAGVEGEKEKCKRLISCLAPAVLKADAGPTRMQLRKNKRMWNIEKEQSKSVNKSGASKPDTPSGKGAAHPKKAATEKKEPSQPKGDKKADKPADKKASKKLSKPREPPSPCPKCHVMHWPNDCPKETDAEKVELRNKLREANKVRKSRVKRLMKLMPSASRTMTINGVLELPCCPDTGSDHTMISQSHWVMLLAADPSVQQLPLNSPVDIVKFGAYPFAGAVPCLITDTDGAEFIIVRDLLGAPGIDVDRQLEQLAVHSEDKTSAELSIMDFRRIKWISYESSYTRMMCGVWNFVTILLLACHRSKLKFYADSNLNVTEEPLEHISSQGVILAVEKLKGHRWNSKINDYEVLVQWKGLESIEDSYEPLSSLARDIETLVKQYVATADQKLQEYWQRVTKGGEQQQQENAASTPLLKKKTRSKKRNRSCQQQRQPAVNQDVPDHSPDNVLAEQLNIDGYVPHSASNPECALK